MKNQNPLYYDVKPDTDCPDRLDLHDNWSTVRDLVQHELAALDRAVLDAVPGARVRPGSNQGGGAHLFAYRVFEPIVGSGIDPVVASILIGAVHGAPADHFKVSGDIAGESTGDVLFEVQPREVTGWTAMTQAARDISTALAGQAIVIAPALKDPSRQE